MLRALVILFATTLLGCSDDAATPSGRPVTVAIEPSDLHSNVGATPVFVIVGRVGPAVDITESDAIVDSVELINPSGVSTALLTERVEDYFGSTGDLSEYFTAFRLTNLSLVDGWNSIRVELRDGVVAAEQSGDQRVIQDATRPVLEARLNPSSAPTIRSVLICGKAEIHKVIVNFSEEVVYNPDSEETAVQISVTLNGASCDRLRLTTDPTSDTTTVEADFACAPLNGDGEFAVALGPDLKSPTGVSAIATREQDSTQLLGTIDLDSVAETCVPLPIP